MAAACLSKCGERLGGRAFGLHVADLRAEGAHLGEGLLYGEGLVIQLLRDGGLLLDGDGRRLHARVQLEGERLRVTLAVGGELDGVAAGGGPNGGDGGRGVVGYGRGGIVGAAAAASGYGERCMVHVPQVAMHAGSGGQAVRRTHPVGGNREVRIDGLLGIGAGVAAHEGARAVEDFERDRAAGVGAEVVVEDGAIGRIGRRRAHRAAAAYRCSCSSARGWRSGA